MLCAIQRSQVRSEVLNALLFDIRKLLVRKRVDRRIAAIREKMEQSAAAGEVCLSAPRVTVSTGNARALRETEIERRRHAPALGSSTSALLGFGANILCDLQSDGIS